MNVNSKRRNPEAEGRKFWAVVCVCVAGLMCATLLAIGLNSAKADVADVTFDDVTINAGAKISLNGTHTVTGLYGNKLLADETNGEEVESAETDAIVASFASEHYENDALTNNLTNASLLDISTFNTNRPFLQTVDKGFWLTDESSTYGVATQAWRTASNGTETLTKDAQGKAPDGTLFTPAPEWAARDYLNYKLNNNPLKCFQLDGYDLIGKTQLGDCSWAGKTYVWTQGSSARTTCWEYDTTIAHTIYPGKEIYNNPWCIEDHSRGFYKTTATSEWWVANGIGGRVEIYEGSDTVEPEVFMANDYLIYKYIKAGDTLFLDVTSNFLQDSTGFLHYTSNKLQHSEFYNIYFKADEDGEITRQYLYIGPEAIGWSAGKEDGEEIKGLPIEAGKHAVRPSWEPSNIAFFRGSGSNEELAVSSTTGSAPLKAVSNGASVKSVVKSQDVKINFDVNLDNCETDRDEGRNKCTKVEGTTIKVPWKSKELTLKNVGTENANYVSALVQTSANKKYGVLAKADRSDVKLDLTNILSNTLIGDKVTVSLYAEKANDAGFSDEISATPVTFQVEVAALAPQRIVYDANGGTGTVPADTVGKAGEQVQIADGSGLYGATGNPFSYWELSYEPFEQTGQVVRKYKSGDQLVMPDAITYPECGIITAKAIYSGGIEVEKSSETTGEYNRVVWDSNQGDDFEARIDSESGDRTKTSLFKTTDGVASISESGIPDVINITEGSNYVCIGWSKDKNAKLGDDGVLSKSQLKNSELTEKKVTYYAVWFQYVESYYWLGTKNASSDYVDEEYFAYNDANYYPGTQIKKDMDILHKVTGTTDEQYASTLAKWQQFYANDEVRLYTTYQGGDATPLEYETAPVNHPENGLCEFRILEVSGYGGHLNTAGDATSGDGSVVTFMATHLLPTGYYFFEPADTTGGWKISSIRNKFLEGGEIYNKFNETFAGAVRTVEKKSHPGGTVRFDSGTEYLSQDKFWVLSMAECNIVTGLYGGPVWSVKEGTSYDYLRNQNLKHIVNNQKCLSLSSRAGKAPGAGGAEQSTSTSNRWLMRTPYMYSGNQMISVSSTGLVESTYIKIDGHWDNTNTGINFCFCF